MDKFKNRIRYFAIGLFFGTIIVYFMFGNRGCSWLPENRVKNMVGEKEIIAGDSILEIMNCLPLDNDDIYALLKDEGDVIFSESKTDRDPKIYLIEGEKEDKLYWAEFALYETYEFSEVQAVYLESAPACTSQKSNAGKSTIPLPHNDVIAILESHEFRILTEAECQMSFYGIEEAALLEFHKTATIDIGASEPRKSPNPNYVLKGLLNNVLYSVKYVVGENRTRIESIKGTEDSGCPPTPQEN